MLNRALKLTLLLAVFALIFGSAFVPVRMAFAQDVPVVDTPVPEPSFTPVTPSATPVTPSATPVTPSATPVTPSATPVTPGPEGTPTPTPEPGTNPTATPAPAPEPEPVPIPEPVTIALFGTGLAALSGVLARRRNKKD